MRRVSSTELQNNFGHYLLVAQEQEIIVTRNGKDVAKLSGLSIRRDLMAERAPTPGYGLRKASFEEFLELTKEETLERYEYIDGEIFLQASPKVGHQFTSFRLANKLGDFFAGKSCVPFAAPFDITISRYEGDINVVQPDLMVICDLREKLGDDGYYHGVPELVMEILSDETKRNDLLKKLNLYLDGGVKEYWVVDPPNKQVFIYHFAEGNIINQKAFTCPEQAISFHFPDLAVELNDVFL
ncbi:MAG: type II toxin-antitoxin system Phd/YefM family antitoxin [Firmicutes bacterium]|nr:type II toxin-antitoxin system Phd/YefM family antitoxin [Bacillota bacterium]